MKIYNLKYRLFRILGMYSEDGLISCHNHDFIKAPDFLEAYSRGIRANGGQDPEWRWRVLIGLWAAAHAVRLEGDFVECGVNRGFLSTAIMQDLKWNELGKRFFLFDTFCGLDPRYVSEREVAGGVLGHRYVECFEEAKRNFSKFKNVTLVRGSVPDTLGSVDIPKVAYLSIDMNNAAPEVAALEIFWPRLVTGGLVLFDDYARRGVVDEKIKLDRAASAFGVRILSLPTGQGLLIKS